jgi:hypothetical protein
MTAEEEPPTNGQEPKDHDEEEDEDDADGDGDGGEMT